MVLLSDPGHQVLLDTAPQTPGSSYAWVDKHFKVPFAHTERYCNSLQAAKPYLLNVIFTLPPDLLIFWTSLLPGCPSPTE